MLEASHNFLFLGSSLCGYTAGPREGIAVPWERPGARQKAARCGLDMPRRMGEGRASGVPWGEGLGKGDLEGWGEAISKRDEIGETPGPHAQKPHRNGGGHQDPGRLQRRIVQMELQKQGEEAPGRPE